MSDNNIYSININTNGHQGKPRQFSTIEPDCEDQYQNLDDLKNQIALNKA